jgi:hypothetical protein
MPFDLRFKTSFNMLISGSSQSGKTTFVKNLLTIKEQIFTEKPAKIILFYRDMQDIYIEMQENNLIDELINVATSVPSLDDIYSMVHPYKDKGGCLLIFDDSMGKLTSDFEQLFCNLSHHENTSIIFITQNLFYKDKSFRTMSLNAHYMVLMKNERDKQQIATLGKQFSPKNSAYIIQSYMEATKNPYSYLILDFCPNTETILRVRSHIFPHQFPTVIYLER